MVEDQNASHTISNDHIKSGLIEFAKLGLSMIYIANGSAIIAILSALPKFDTSEKCTIFFTLLLFLFGIAFAIGATFCAYMTHRNLTEKIDLTDEKEITWFPRARNIAIASFAFFAIGSLFALQLIS